MLVDAPTTLIFFVRAVGAPRPPIGVLDDAPTTPTFLFVLFVLLDSPQVCSTMLLLLLLPPQVVGAVGSSSSSSGSSTVFALL